MTVFGYSRLRGEHEGLAFEWLQTAINENIDTSIMKIKKKYDLNKQWISMFTIPYMEEWNTFDHATLYGVNTVCDGENSSIIQFSSMEIPGR